MDQLESTFQFVMIIIDEISECKIKTVQCSYDSLMCSMFFSCSLALMFIKIEKVLERTRTYIYIHSLFCRLVLRHLLLLCMPFFSWCSISIKRVGERERKKSNSCSLKLSKSLMIFCDSAFALNSCFGMFVFGNVDALSHSINAAGKSKCSWLFNDDDDVDENNDCNDGEVDDAVRM